MAKSDAKAKKTSKRKMKIPKEVGGVKIPKEVRKEGVRLIAAATALITTQAAGAMLKAAMANIRAERERRPPRPPRDSGSDGR